MSERIDRMWEWLGSTRIMRRIIEAVEAWFARTSDRENPSDDDR